MATNDRNMEQQKNKGSSQDPNRSQSGMGSSTSQQSGKPGKSGKSGSQGSQSGSSSRSSGSGDKR